MRALRGKPAPLLGQARQGGGRLPERGAGTGGVGRGKQRAQAHKAGAQALPQALVARVAPVRGVGGHARGQRLARRLGQVQYPGTAHLTQPTRLPIVQGLARMALHARAADQVRGAHAVAQKVHPVGHGHDAAGVAQGQAQLVVQKLRDARAPALQCLYIGRQQHKVVHIAQVVAAFEVVFDELIELVQVHVGEELAGEVAYGQAHAGGRVDQALVRGQTGKAGRIALQPRALGSVAGEQAAREPEQVVGLIRRQAARISSFPRWGMVGMEAVPLPPAAGWPPPLPSPSGGGRNSTLPRARETKQYRVGTQASLGQRIQPRAVDAIEEVGDVQLQRKARPGAVAGLRLHEAAQPLRRAVDALAPAVGPRVEDEHGLKTPLQARHQQVVHHAVAKGGGQYFARLGPSDDETGCGGWPPLAALQSLRGAQQVVKHLLGVALRAG